MKLNMTFKRSPYDYLRITAFDSDRDPRLDSYVSIHLNHESFVRSVKSAEIQQLHLEAVLDASKLAWNEPGTVTICEGIEMTSDQCSHLRLVPHTKGPKNLDNEVDAVA